MITRPIIFLVLTLLPSFIQGKVRSPEKIWATFCIACHGALADGNTPTGKALGVPDLTSPEYAERRNRDVIRTQIAEGLKDEKGVIKMAPYKSILSTEEIDSLVDYIWALQPEANAL